MVTSPVRPGTGHGRHPLFLSTEANHMPDTATREEIVQGLRRLALGLYITHHP